MFPGAQQVGHPVKIPQFTVTRAITYFIENCTVSMKKLRNLNKIVILDLLRGKIFDILLSHHLWDVPLTSLLWLQAH